MLLLFITPLTFLSTPFSSLFSFSFPLGITKSLSNFFINISTIIFIDHSNAQGTKRNSVRHNPNPVISVDWGSGWLWICHISICPTLVGCYWFFLYYAVYYSLLCWQFPSSLFWSLIPITISYCKWNQQMNDIALGMHIPCQMILKPPFCRCQAFLTLGVEKPTQKHTKENQLTLNNKKWVCPGNCVWPESCSLWLPMD